MEKLVHSVYEGFNYALQANLKKELIDAKFYKKW